jgi:hypothetical protein
MQLRKVQRKLRSRTYLIFSVSLLSQIVKDSKHHTKLFALLNSGIFFTPYPDETISTEHGKPTTISNFTTEHRAARTVCFQTRQLKTVIIQYISTT